MSREHQTFYDKLGNVSRTERVSNPKNYAIAGQLIGTDWVVRGSVDRVSHVRIHESSEMGYSYATLNIHWQFMDKTNLTVDHFVNEVKGYYDDKGWDIKPSPEDDAANEIYKIIRDDK